MMLNYNSFVILWLTIQVISDFTSGLNTLVDTSLDTSLVMLIEEASTSGIFESKGVRVVTAFDSSCQSSFQKDHTRFVCCRQQMRTQFLLPGPDQGYHQKTQSITDFIVNFISLFYIESLQLLIKMYISFICFQPFLFFSPLHPAHFLCPFFY